MKKPARAFSRSADYSVKRSLTVLNRDLSKVVSDLDDTLFDDIRWRHSIRERDANLAPFILAVLTLEDRRFFRHRGFEPLRSAFRSLRRFISGQRLGGISTIDQQVIRISRKRFERTLARKSSEILLARVLNLHRSKAKILQYYIHNAYYGYRLEGCEIAANVVFGVQAVALDGAGSAIIAAALARPIPRSIVIHMSQLPHSKRNPEEFFRIANIMHPKYAVHIQRRVDYCQSLLTDRFKSRLIR